jgi:DNA invertase Pin-like site-specific DNA recombinase
MRVAFYIRVSTQEQFLEGYSPEFQLEQLNDHVKRKEYKGWYTKPEWHFEDVKSGGDTVDRDCLKNLMQLVRAKEIDLVLVWRIDRLSRRLSDLLDLFEEMDKCKVGFASVKEDLDFTGAIGKLIFQIFGALAEFERENIRMRTEEGKKASAKHGNYVGGSIPYGYVPVRQKGIKGTKLKPVPQEIGWVKQIFTWFAYEKKEPEWIASELDRLAVPKGKGNPRIAGTKWIPETIEEMLGNDLYRGAYITNRYRLESKKPERYEVRPKEEWIHTEIKPPAIDITLFYLAQNRLKNAPKRSPTQGGGKEKYLLRSKLLDIQTGKGFVGYKSTKNTKNYRRKDFADKDGVYHPSISIAANGIEEFVWKYIEMAINRPEEFLKKHREQSSDGKQRARLIEDFKRYEDSITRANKQLKKAEELLFNEVIAGSVYQERMMRYTNQRDEAAIHKQKAEEEIVRLGKYDVGCENLKTFAESFDEGIPKLTFDQKRSLVDVLVDRIEITETEQERRAKVFFRFDPKAIAASIPEGRTDIVQHKAEKPLKELPHHGTWWVGRGSNPRPMP